MPPASTCPVLSCFLAISCFSGAQPRPPAAPAAAVERAGVPAAEQEEAERPAVEREEAERPVAVAVAVVVPPAAQRPRGSTPTPIPSRLETSRFGSIASPPR